MSATCSTTSMLRTTSNFAGIRQFLGGGRAIVDIDAGFGRMQLRHLDVGLGSVGPDHLGAEAGHRLAQKPAAAADVEDAQALERTGFAWIAPEALRHLVADIGEADGVELVQRAKLAVRVPPFGGKRGKAFHFRGIDGRSSGVGHVFSPCKA